MTLVAIAAHRHILGVEAPGTKKKIRGVVDSYTYDWREAPQTGLNTAGVQPELTVSELTDALERRYHSDAHLAMYVVSHDGVPLARQPRVNKSSLDWLHAHGHSVATDVLVVDVDNPHHEHWTDDLKSRFLALWADPPASLLTCGVYLTRAGYHLVQPLDEPVVVSEVERHIASWFAELESQGVPVDWRAHDWTRLYRLPNVLRDRKPFYSPFVDLSRMRPRVIDPKAWPRPLRRGGERNPRSLTLSPSLASSVLSSSPRRRSSVRHSEGPTRASATRSRYRWLLDCSITAQIQQRFPRSSRPLLSRRAGTIQPIIAARQSTRSNRRRGVAPYEKMSLRRSTWL